MEVWVVRAGEESRVFDEFKNKSLMAIGWEEMGDCSALRTRSDFEQRYRETYPEDTNPRRVAIQVGQVYRFAQAIAVGDIVITPDSPRREMAFGRVAGEYEYAPSKVDGQGKLYPHVRQVEWLQTVSRDDMSEGLRASTGSITTVSKVEGHEEELDRLLKGDISTDAGGTEEASFLEDTQAKADELISDILSRIGPYEFQDLVAALLRAMGFRTKVSPPGPDGGKDIVAHPDALGFEQPCIKVQVKHTKGSVGAPDVRNFRSVIRPDEKGLFVSTGGFTADAQREPERTGAPLTLMDRDDFVDLFTEHYEDIEPEYQAMVPLRKVYIPVTSS